LLLGIWCVSANFSCGHWRSTVAAGLFRCECNDPRCQPAHQV
jgi:hypothetical protein